MPRFKVQQQEFSGEWVMVERSFEFLCSARALAKCCRGSRIWDAGSDCEVF
jgi:hypothetical protein